MSINGVLHFAPIAFGYPGTNIYVNPALINKYTNTTNVGDTFNVTLNYGNMTNLAGIQYTLYWNNTVLNVTNVHDKLPWSGSPFVATNTTTEDYNASFGQMSFNAIPTPLVGANGNATFRTITFKILTAPPTGFGNLVNSSIAFGPYGTETIFGNTNAEAISATVYNGEFSLMNTPTISEFQPFMLLPLLMIVTLLAVAICTKKRDS